MPGPEQSGGGGIVPVIKSTPLEINGVLYFTIPDHVWAVDARSGRQIWHYEWKNSKGGWHIGNRGVGVSGDWLYFETPDCNLVSLNLKDGKERWHTEICDLNQFYYASVAPVVVKQPRDHGSERRRSGHSRLHRIARSGDRRAAVALVCASRAGRSRSRRPGRASKR